MEMRVYVGTYEKYNNGSLVGKWMDIADYLGSTDFYRACRELHSDEADPELMFQDWEGIPDCMICESWIDDEVFEFSYMDDDDIELLVDYRETCKKDGTLEEAKDALVCKVDDWDDYVYESAEEELCDVSDFNKCYFDYKAYGKDLAMDYNFGNVYVFRNF